MGRKPDKKIIKQYESLEGDIMKAFKKRGLHIDFFRWDGGNPFTTEKLSGTWTIMAHFPTKKSGAEKLRGKAR